MMKITTCILFITFSLAFMTSSLAQNAKTTVTARLNHIAVYVENLDKSAFFYERLFNLPKIEEPFKDGKHVWLSLGAAGQLHLIQGPGAKVRQDKNSHLCFSVPSVEDFMVLLEKHKIDFSNWPGTAKVPTLRSDGVKQIYLQDPDGYWLEVNDAK